MRRTVVGAAAAVALLTGLAGAALADPPVAQTPGHTFGGARAHPHHVLTGSATHACVDINAVLFLPDTPDLH